MVFLAHFFVTEPYLKFEVDGAEEFSSYDADWSNVVVKVSGRGTHTLKWTYLKNASKSAGDDCTSPDAIVETPQIVARPSVDGTSLTFTVAPPEGDKGFVRILIE